MTQPNQTYTKADGWICSYSNRKLVPCHKPAQVVIEVGELKRGACWRHRQLVERSMTLVPIWHWLTS